MEDFDFVLSALLKVALQFAIRIPTQIEPPEPNWSTDADAYVKKAAENEVLFLMSPEVAAALIPRLIYARKYASEIQKELDNSLGREATAGELFEALLMSAWHSRFYLEWLQA